MTSSAAALVERRGRSPEPPGERALLMLGGAYGGDEFHWCDGPWDPEWRKGAGCFRCSPWSVRLLPGGKTEVDLAFDVPSSDNKGLGVRRDPLRPPAGPAGARPGPTCGRD